MVEDLVVLVRGGASEYITTLAHKELPTAELMREWGDAVQYNPAIIRLKVPAATVRTPPLCRIRVLRVCVNWVWNVEIVKAQATILSYLHYTRKEMWE